MSAGGLVVVLLGAECTGKTTLARDLRDALAAQGHDAVVVPEFLRAFCEVQGRAPLAREQASIAREQSARIAAAAAQHAIVIADTSAMMTAVYSDLFFGDASLYALAQDAHRGSAVTLLTGLDLPWQADGIQRAGAESRIAGDARLRAALERLEIPYVPVKGNLAERLQAAWAAVQHVLPVPASRKPPRGP